MAEPLLPPLGGAASPAALTPTAYITTRRKWPGMTPATAPVELAAMTINPATIHTGQGPVVMTASFVGSQPITYQWQANTGTGFTNIPGATATTYTIPVATVALQGTYVCLASNNNSFGTPPQAPRKT